MKTLRPAFRNRPQRGYSLAEVMVAMAVFTAIVLAALMIYDRSNRVFNQGVQASDMQQSTRVAFDKVVSDVRLAGFDYDRDGIPFGAMAPAWTPSTGYVAGNLVQPNPPNGYVYQCANGGQSNTSPPSWPTSKTCTTFSDGTVTWACKDQVQYQQPDEQFEYAGESAITLRANFDYETATGPCVTSGTPIPCENGREKALESAQFPLVTTNNSEIVTYALVSNSNNSNANKDSVVFYADTDSPRDVNPSTKKKEAKVTITGVDLTNNYPPYTLYRYTLDSTGAPVGTPIADNIRSMTFSYFTDNAGTVALATPLPYGNGQYDGAAPDTQINERDARASIKSVRINLVGMNPSPDGAYTDADAAASHYRKYQLASLVVPRNIGKHGMKEFSTTVPGTPTIKTVCTAGCNAVYVTWEAAITGGDVDSYNILYDVGNCGGNVSYAIAEDAGTNLAGYATKVTPGQQYRFAVQAINKYGAATSSNCIAATVLNTTQPGDPTALDASGSATGVYPIVAGGVHLYWPPVTLNNTSNATMDCSDGTTKAEPNVSPGESVRYRIWRNKNQSFTVPDPNDSSTWTSGTKLVLSETSATQPAPSGTNLTWTDVTLPMGSCIDYFYRIQAVAYPCCNADSLNKSGNKTMAASQVFPTSGNAVKGRTETTATPDLPTGVGISNLSCSGAVCDVKVTWNKVVADTTGAFMFIDSYIATLYQQDVLGNWTVVDTNTTFNGSSSTTFNNLNTTNIYKVTVKAKDCVTGGESLPAFWPCNWNGGTITVGAPVSYGGSGSSGNPWVIQYPSNILVQTTSPIQKVDFAVFNGPTQIGTTQTINGPASSFNFSVPQTPDGITCKVHITMTALAPSTCVINQDYWVVDQAAPGCALKDVNTDPTVMSWTSGNNYVDVILKNNSTDQLTPLKAYVKWDNSNQGPAKFSSGISSIKFDNSGTATEGMTATCASANVVADVSAASPGKINASQTNYVLRVTFAVQSGKSLSGNPISSVCIQYRTPFGDVKTCSVAPNAGNCAIPASNCN